MRHSLESQSDSYKIRSSLKRKNVNYWANQWEAVDDAKKLTIKEEMKTTS